MSVWQGLVSIGFFVMLALTIWAWVQNGSLRQQLAEQRTARIEQATRAHHLMFEKALAEEVTKLAVRTTDEVTAAFQTVQDMNRILAEEYRARQSAAEARRIKAQQRKEKA